MATLVDSASDGETSKLSCFAFIFRVQLALVPALLRTRMQVQNPGSSSLPYFVCPLQNQAEVLNPELSVMAILVGPAPDANKSTQKIDAKIGRKSRALPALCRSRKQSQLPAFPAPFAPLQNQAEALNLS